MQLGSIFGNAGVNVQKPATLTPLFKELINAKSKGFSSEQIASELNNYTFTSSDVDTLVGLASTMDAFSSDKITPQMRQIAQMLGVKL